jgi:hypothetical protein
MKPGYSLMTRLLCKITGPFYTMTFYHSIRQFLLHFLSHASPCAVTFQLDSTPLVPKQQIRDQRPGRPWGRRDILLGLLQDACKFKFLAWPRSYCKTGPGFFFYICCYSFTFNKLHGAKTIENLTVSHLAKKTLTI